MECITVQLQTSIRWLPICELWMLRFRPWGVNIKRESLATIWKVNLHFLQLTLCTPFSHDRKSFGDVLNSLISELVIRTVGTFLLWHDIIIPRKPNKFKRRCCQCAINLFYQYIFCGCYKIPCVTEECFWVQIIQTIFAPLRTHCRCDTSS